MRRTAGLVSGLTSATRRGTASGSVDSTIWRGQFVTGLEGDASAALLVSRRRGAPEPPPVLADTPDVNGEEKKERHRENDAMKNVEAKERIFGDDVAAEEKEADLLADEGSFLRHVRAHRDSPERELVPGEEVARVREKKRHDEEHDSHDPVELTRRTVGAVVEDPEHVEKRREYHEVRRPAVQVAQEQAVVDDVMQLLHVAVGLRDRRVVIEHQQNPGRDQDDGAHERDAAEPVGVREAEGLLPDLDRMHVQEEVLTKIPAERLWFVAAAPCRTMER